MLATCSVMCKEKYSAKLEYIFALFDYNQSKTLNFDELRLSITSFFNGICRLVGLELPTVKDIAHRTGLIMKFADVVDLDFRLSYDEFRSYMKHDFETQDFLLKYCGTQTYANANRRYKVNKF